jgi:hypothetical protein
MAEVVVHEEEVEQNSTLIKELAELEQEQHIHPKVWIYQVWVVYSVVVEAVLDLLKMI